MLSFFLYLVKQPVTLNAGYLITVSINVFTASST